MEIGRILGTVVATRKDERLIGHKLMIVQTIDIDEHPKGEAVVAVDTVGAGIGELVLFTRGTSARFAVNKTQAPIDSAIIGIIDHIDVYKEIFSKE